MEDEVGLHVLPLSVLLLDTLGPDYLAWTSEALHAELEDRFGKIGVVTWERIQALRVLHAHDAFWKEWEVFEKITAAILGEAPIFSFVQPPEAEEIAVSLTVAKKINGENEFSDDVLGYIAAACLNDGLWYLEAPLNVAEPALTDYDRKHEILRDFAGVAGELEKSTQYREDLVDPTLTQVNRVLDVRSVLKRYDAAVSQQLAALPSLIEGK